MTHREVNNSNLVNEALHLLRDGLAPFVERITKSRARLLDHGKLRRFLDDPKTSDKPISSWDILALLKWMTENWNTLFRQDLHRRMERSLVGELHDWRNNWAHQVPISTKDAYRVLDSAERLLEAIGAPQAQSVGMLKKQQLNVLYADQQPDRGKRVATVSVRTASRIGESQADRIRRHVLNHYVEAWRKSGQLRLAIRAGDVHRELGLRNATPNVCSALEGRKLLELGGLKLVKRTGPRRSTTTTFHYERATVVV